MSEYFIMFDAATGAVRFQGMGPPGATAAQVLPAGADIIPVPPEAIMGEQTDFARIRDHAVALVADAAAQATARTVTPGAEQALLHAEKLAEAAAWHTAANPEDFPYLMGEVAATGLSFDEAAAGIVAGAAAGRPRRARIEGKRRAANIAIRAGGENLAAIKAAMAVDFSE